MNNSYRFDPKKMAEDTANAYSAGLFNSWTQVARVLAKRGFNSYEAEAILRSKWTRWCRDEFHGRYGMANSRCLEKYLDKNGYVPGHKSVNSLVLQTFEDLEANEHGVPCRRRKIPGISDHRTTLVPVGTPACCDPTRETYWSM